MNQFVKPEDIVEDTKNERWVTIEGRHVNIGKGGAIIAGGFVGKDGKELSVGDKISTATISKTSEIEKPKEGGTKVAGFEYMGLTRNYGDMDSDNAPSKMHHYKSKTDTDIYIDPGSKNSHEAILKNVNSAFAAVPKEDRGLIKSVTVYTGNMAIVNLSGVNSKHAIASANGTTKNIAIFHDMGTDKHVGGMIVHEIGHLTTKSRTNEPDEKFKKLLAKEKSNITGYGTKDKPAEAFAEAYSKFVTTGKVMAEAKSGVVQTELKSLTKYFQDKYPDHQTRKGAENWMLRK